MARLSRSDGLVGSLTNHPVVPRRACLGETDLMTAGPSDDAEPSVCPACGAGPDRTDPSNMSRSVCFCGHPRYYDNKHAEGLCPCQS